MLRIQSKIVSAIAVVAVLTTASLAQAGSLTTLFAGGNGQDGNMFDIIAYNDLTITGWDINSNRTAGGTTPIAVYYRLGGYSGFEDSAADWTLLGSENVTSNGPETATALNVGGLNLLSGNTYGIYITATSGEGLSYTDGDGYSEGDIYSSNSDLAITVGVGKGHPFGNTYTPRIWNGTVHYETSASNGNGDPNAVPTPAALGSGMMLLGAMLLKRRRQAA